MHPLHLVSRLKVRAGQVVLFLSVRDRPDKGAQTTPKNEA
jgi:hypothetical protein